MEQKFRKLKIWQKSIDFTSRIYKLSSEFPKDELFGLTSQIRRASNSIALNIAEGSGCLTNKEFKRFLNISLRSVYEVISALEIAIKLKYISLNQASILMIKADELAAMIHGLIKKI